MLIPLTDNHFHSTFSKDGTSSLNAIIERQYQFGLKVVTNTEHYDADPQDSGFGYYDYNAIENEIIRLRKLYPLTIFHGVEVTYQSKFIETIDKFLDKYKFDLIIGSIHYIEGKLIRQWSEKAEDFTPYFKLLVELSNWKKMNVLGHLDYVKKYTTIYKEKNYLGFIETILKNLIKNNKALGINTSGFRRMAKEQYPSDNILKIYKDLGGELISIGSDSHNISHVGYGYGELNVKLKKLGFKKYHYFENSVIINSFSI